MTVSKTIYCFGKLALMVFVGINMVSHINATRQHMAEMDHQFDMKYQENTRRIEEGRIRIQQANQRDRVQEAAEQQRMAADRARFNKEYAATKAKIAEGQRIVAQKDAAGPKRDQAVQAQNVSTKAK